MSKQLVFLNSLGPSSINSVSAGSYSVNSIEFDSYGRIVSFPTGAGFGNVVGLSGSAGRIVTGGSNTSPIVDLAQIVTSSTYLMPSQITIDAYGRTTAVTTASGVITSATYSGTNISIGPVTINSRGYLSSVSTSTPGNTGTNLTLTNITFQGTTTYIIGNITEPMPTLAGSGGGSGIVIHDFSLSNNWQHISITFNFTANFINMLTDPGFVYNASLFLFQGNTGYIPNAVQINGSAQTIQWSGGSAPTGSANKTDIVSFTFINTNTSWIVVGNLTSYG
jgi:hypothetical protein